MARRTSEGRTYPQRVCVCDEQGSEWPSPTTELWPSPAQADTLVATLQERGIESAVSIGCGEGACEAMLEARGLHVHAVDLDVLSNTSHYSTMRQFCREIRRVRPDELFKVPQPEVTALCFFWGRKLPWREYLEHYPSIPVVVIAGERVEVDSCDCATEPRGGALHGAEGWRVVHEAPVRAVHGGAVWSVHERCDLG